MKNKFNFAFLKQKLTVFNSITSRSFWFNLLVAAVLSLLAILFFLWGLDFITNHGEAKKVPVVKGKDIHEAIKILESEGFEAEVQDSVYYDSIPHLQVTRQLPEPGELVKVNRVIYLTVNKVVPPIIEMPNLIGQSEAGAKVILQALGLKIGHYIMKPDFARGSVLQQLKDGNEIKPGTELNMGSAVDLVIGAGIEERGEMFVPDLIGMTYGEAKSLLEQNDIFFGAIAFDPDVKDTATAYIYKQNPSAKDEEGAPLKMNSGQIIDVYLSKKRPIRDSVLTNQNDY
ncbi:MAG TPA: PASTA domain-containing protein [Chitinophagaceae bacterium]|nr:PASTA domain-containing protein [Chitinophagaceae bacterium]